jgi:hypothetical protein
MTFVKLFLKVMQIKFLDILLKLCIINYYFTILVIINYKFSLNETDGRKRRASWQ